MRSRRLGSVPAMASDPAIATARFNWLFDRRTGCWSVQTTLAIRSYIELVRGAHQAQGAIAGQRDVLTTTTAKRIRTRMVADLRQGAVLPPVVLGVVVGEALFDDFPLPDVGSLDDILPPREERQLSIIDGMQRTAAILEAVDHDASIENDSLRVEFWLATNVRSMIYRMLVLNTGQVPWTITRQLSVVYAPLLQEIIHNVPELEKVSTPDRPGRRVAAAQYSSDAIVELYIAFSLRKTTVDTREAVSDEFSRLDFVDNLSDNEFQNQFYGALTLMARLDKAFSRYGSDSQQQLRRGRSIFDRQPARIGFIVAVGSHVLGRPGGNRSAEDRSTRLAALKRSVDGLIGRLNDMDMDSLGDFLRVDVMSEILDRRVGQVGRYERSVFAEAFKVLVEEDFNIENLEPCWRAS